MCLGIQILTGRTAQLTDKARAKSAWEITFAIERERRSGATASAPGSSPRPDGKALRQPGCTPKAGPASSSRAAGTANRAVDCRGGGAAPPGGGAHPVRSRPPPPPPPAGLAPFTDSRSSVLPSGGSSGLPRPARHLAPVPAPCYALTPPSTRRAVPRCSLAERERRAPAGSAEPFRRPRPLHRGARRGCPAGVRREWGAQRRHHGPFHFAFPPPPRGARAPGDAMEPRRSERHKGARGTMGAVSPWAQTARSGGSALRGGGRSSRRARPRQPPFSSPPLLPPPPRHGCCSHSPVCLPWSCRHRAAGLIRPALTWDTSSVLC